MVFGLPPQDTLLLRWKIIDMIALKEAVRRIAVQIRNRRYLNLHKVCIEMESLVTQLQYMYEDLIWFCRVRNILYVWGNMGEVWENYNVLWLDFRWN